MPRLVSLLPEHGSVENASNMLMDPGVFDHVASNMMYYHVASNMVRNLKINYQVDGRSGKSQENRDHL